MLNEINSMLNEFTQKRAALKAELTELEQKEAASKANLHAEAVAQAQALLDAFDIAPDEVTFKAKRTLKPKYRDPETGKTWHGFGKRPACFKGIKNLDAYLIDGPKTSATTTKKNGPNKTNGEKRSTDQPVASATASNPVAEANAVESNDIASMRASAHAVSHPHDQAPSPDSASEDGGEYRLATFYEHSPAFGSNRYV
ncbi:H-NS histone family protein [Paraburkholderia lycopersici]|uniref:DNA-binding protein H-NS n=1 Tax=Paraburkholderia lycopersici TaxID=416944 RepID=A0A1G6GVF2_9BURK|nr:H-NS histone family protein [Paraburkholderia lycopersici]SDB85948.1 DNA-binding protein H-NS [Paraburkholderia lycopersici]